MPRDSIAEFLPSGTALLLANKSANRQPGWVRSAAALAPSMRDAASPCSSIQAERDATYGAPLNGVVTSIQKTKESWYCQFYWQNGRYRIGVGQVSMLRAEVMATHVGEIVEPRERRRLKMPPDVTKPPAIPWPRRSV